MSDTYLLSRDADETQRLAFQHSFWTRSLDYLIHPAIAKTLPSTARIADVATGTAAWAVAVAREKPNAKVTGLDISDKQFPAKDVLPSNVILRVHDLREAFSSSLIRQFDLVHVRLVQGAVPNQDAWNHAVSNITTLLKPAGWLQWEEGDYMPLARPCRAGPVASPAGPSGATGGAGSLREKGSAMRQAWTVMSGTMGEHIRDVPQKLEAAFAAAGMRGVDVDCVSSERVEGGRRAGTELEVGVVRSMQRQWRAVKGQVPPLFATEEEDDKLVEGILREMKDGGYVMFFMVGVLGKKAVEGG